MANKKRYLAFKIVLGIAAFVGAERLCYQATSGFQVSRISTPSTLTSFEQGLVNPAISDEVRSLLQQPFQFLGSGSQSYAFVSADGQYVLKVFKQHHFYIPPFPAKLTHLQEKKREQFMKSCALAATCWKQETGTLYAHLSPSDDLDCTLTLTDKLNISHKLQAGSLQFAVQKKASLVSPTLQSFLDEGNKEAAEECIRSLIALIKTRSQKGIGDRDPVVRRNFGFIDKQAVEIDIGSYYENPFICKEPLFSRAVFFEIKNLRGWLMNHFPQLAPIAEKELEPFILY